MRIIMGNQKTETTEQEYLTEDEVLKVDFYQLAQIREKLSNKRDSGKYTEEELNIIVANEIKDSKQKNINILSDYEIPGFGKLTDAEVALAKKYPIEFVNYGATA